MAVNKVVYGDETIMDITDSTVNPENVIENNVFYDRSGARQVGTLGDATAENHGLMSAADKAKLDEFEDASNYLTEHQDISGKADSASLSAVATSGSYNDLLNKPTNVSDFNNDAGYLTQHQDISGKANSADLADVATSGSYNDLADKPFIPSAVSDLTDDSGHYTKPVTGIPAVDLEETYLTSFTETDPTVPSWAKAAQKPTYTAQEVGALPDNTFIPSKVSDLQNDSGYLTEHQDISGKADKSEIPTSVSQLTNDSGYLTSFTETDPTVPSWAKAAQKPTYTAAEVGAPTVSEMNTAIGTAIGNVHQFEVQVVQALPTQNIQEHTVYFVPKTGETNDVYDEYIYVNNAWEMIGNTQIDLSNYATKSEIPTVPVQDVQVNKISVINNGIANIPIANSSTFGVVKVNVNEGVSINSNNTLVLATTTDNTFKTGTANNRAVVPSKQHIATFYGLAKAAGDTTQSQSSNAVGTYTAEAKAAIRSMIGAKDESYAPDLSNYVQKTDYATADIAGVIKVSGASYGIMVGVNGLLASAPAGNYGLKTGQESYRPIVPEKQHMSVFYGLAKAAGDTTQAQSDNAIGTYTADAQAAIQSMLNVPSNSDVVFVPGTGKGSVKLKDFTSDTGAHYSSTASGFGSHAEGLNATASGGGAHAEGQFTIASGSISHAEGMEAEAAGVGSHAEGNTTKAMENFSHAEGTKTIAYGSASHVEGGQTIARGNNSHVEGYANVEDNYTNWIEWQSNTQYIVGDKVKITSTENNTTNITGYICKTDNTDLEFDSTKWNIDTKYNYVHIVGNGQSKNNRSNAYALDWDGNGHYMGNIYVRTNIDSTGGSKVLCEADFATNEEIQTIINGGAGA